MIESPGYTLSIYGISRRGFLPAEPPLSCLPGTYFQPWEDIVRNLPKLLESHCLRAEVDLLPCFETEHLHTQAEWRRAYVVFSFLTHGYIWEGQQPAESLPLQLSLPFSIIADHFALPTTATYAGLNLWNWCPVTAEADITMPENVQMMQTFTGTIDEAWFYLISVCIEAKGGSIIPEILQCFEAVRTESVQMIIGCLKKISDCLHELGVVLNRMHERCDPTIFYHRIRPFLAGSKGMAAAGLPNGVFYDEGNGLGRWRQYSGGSNAQSALIQLFDIALGVDHHATGGMNAKSTDAAVKSKQSYLMEMRNYMPGSHRHFLAHVSSIANIRQYVSQDRCDVAVRFAYHTAIRNLTNFRDIHLRIVSRYIITPAGRVSPMTPKNDASMSAASSSPANSEPTGMQLCGTGGTALMPFLRQTRDETKCAGSFKGNSL